MATAPGDQPAARPLLSILGAPWLCCDHQPNSLLLHRGCRGHREAGSSTRLLAVKPVEMLPKALPPTRT